MRGRIPERETEKLSLRRLSPRIHWRETIDARLEAARIVEQARREAADLKARAKAGIREWRRRAELAAETRLAEDLRAVIDELAVWRSKLADEAEPQLLNLAVAMARRLLVAELSLAPGQVAGLCRQVLEESACVRRDLRLKLCPADVQCLGAMQAPWLAGVDLEEDESLEPGDCVLESPWGRVDARLATRLGLLRDGLLGQALEQRS